LFLNRLADYQPGGQNDLLGSRMAVDDSPPEHFDDPHPQLFFGQADRCQRRLRGGGSRNIIDANHPAADRYLNTLHFRYKGRQFQIGILQNLVHAIFLLGNVLRQLTTVPDQIPQISDLFTRFSSAESD
jgi:hypothetical protein